MDVGKLKEAAEAGGKQEFFVSYMAQHFEWRDKNQIKQPTGVWLEDIGKLWKEIVEDGRTSERTTG
ncbi:hypothetical protein [Bremerella sp. P1]|uniref:hypothetical protein n=1 Tax=Bremerella sp. P1 TaxID=3026424 RepID=UPI002367D8EB|nr:hypothetical protein [Bremerella sp. P1]WDI44760.1 hypothetical protein PSR63_12520 [Bremerella sp. P1]